MVLIRHSGPACGEVTPLFSGPAAMRSGLARVTADGTPIDLLRWPLRFAAFLDFIGMGEVCEPERGFAPA